MSQGVSVSLQPSSPSAGAGAAAEAARRKLARWIARTLASDPPRATSLIVTVWGDALAPHGGDVWLAALIRLMAPFGINDRLVRTSVFRLARDGWLAARTHGRRSRYRLTPEGAQRFADAHRRIYAPPDLAWNGEWDIVIAPPDGAPAAARAALRDALSWAGFGALAPAVYARPVHGDAPPQAIGALPSSGVSVLRARELPIPGTDPLATRIGAAWPLDELATRYRTFVARADVALTALRARGAAPDPEQCFVVRTLLIHAYRRALLRDPQLPPALLPDDWPGAHAYARTRDAYRLAFVPSEAHLARVLASAGEPPAPPNAAYQARFGGLV